MSKPKLLSILQELSRTKDLRGLIAALYYIGSAHPWYTFYYSRVQTLILEHCTSLDDSTSYEYSLWYDFKKLQRPVADYYKFNLKGGVENEKTSQE